MYLRFPFRLVAFGRAGFSNELVHDPRGRVKPPSFLIIFFLVLLAWVQYFAETSFNLRLKKTRASSSSGGGVCGVSAPCFHSKFIRASASFLNVLVNRLEIVEPQVLLQRFTLHPGW